MMPGLRTTSEKSLPYWNFSWCSHLANDTVVAGGEDSFRVGIFGLQTVETSLS